MQVVNSGYLYRTFFIVQGLSIQNLVKVFPGNMEFGGIATKFSVSILWVFGGWGVWAAAERKVEIFQEDSFP